MRTFREIEKCRDYTIVQFLDNKKYTLLDTKENRLADKEFKKIEYFCDFPFEGLYTNLFAVSGFIFTDDDGTFMTNELGHYLIDEEKYFEYLKKFASEGSVDYLKNESMFSFEPYTSTYSMMKAAFMAFEKEYTELYSKLCGEVGEETISIAMEEEKQRFKNIVDKKQEELAEYKADYMLGDEYKEQVQFESPFVPHAPVNYIKGIFGKEPFLENI